MFTVNYTCTYKDTTYQWSSRPDSVGNILANEVAEIIGDITDHPVAMETVITAAGPALVTACALDEQTFDELIIACGGNNTHGEKFHLFGDVRNNDGDTIYVSDVIHGELKTVNGHDAMEMNVLGLVPPVDKFGEYGTPEFDQESYAHNYPKVSDEATHRTWEESPEAVRQMVAKAAIVLATGLSVYIKDTLAMM